MQPALGHAQVRHDEHVPFDDGSYQRIVHLAVAHEVGEAVHARAHQLPRVVVVEDVRHHAQAAGVGLVDDRTIEARIELLHRAAAVVHPDLDHVHGALREFGDVPTPLLRAGHAVGGAAQSERSRARVRGRQPPPGRAQPRRCGQGRRLLAANVEGGVARVRPERDNRADAVVGVAPEVVDDVGARIVAGRVAQTVLEADMTVQADQGRHDRLARQVDAPRGGRRRQLAPRADGRDGAGRNQQHGVLDGCGRQTGDEACAFVGDDRPRNGLRLRCAAGSRDCRHTARQCGGSPSAHAGRSEGSYRDPSTAWVFLFRAPARMPSRP